MTIKHKPTATLTKKKRSMAIDIEILGMPLGNIRIVGRMEPGKHYIARLEEQK